MGFLTSLFAATPENPTFNLNDPAAWEALGAAPTSSGLSVTQQTALTYSPWWRGISLLAGDCGKLPLHIYRRKGDGKERDPEHPSYPLLRRKPNPYQTAFQFRRLLTGWALSRGMGCANILRTGDGRAAELWPLNPDQTYPVRANGVQYFVTHLATGEPRKLPYENVLCIRGFGEDDLAAQSVLDVAKESLGLGLALKKWNSKFFANGARPGVLLETPNKLQEQAKKELRESWERMQGGLDQAHRTAVLDNGLKANVISFNAEESQFIESQQFTVFDVSNFLGIPPHKLGAQEGLPYNSRENADQAYLDESLDPWLVCWEEECWDKLLTEQEKEQDSHVVEFLREALIRADLTARSNYYRTALGGRPWMLQNEVRGRENLNPVPGGDVMLDPLNMGQGGAENKPEPGKPPARMPPSDSRPDRALLRPILLDAAKRMVRRVGHSAARAARKPSEFLGWLDALETEHAATIAEAFAPIAAAGGVTDVLPAVRAMLATIRGSLLDVSGECRPAELPGRVEARMASLEQTVPPAVTEAIL